MGEGSRGFRIYAGPITGTGILPVLEDAPGLQETLNEGTKIVIDPGSEFAKYLFGTE